MKGAMPKMLIGGRQRTWVCASLAILIIVLMPGAVLARPNIPDAPSPARLINDFAGLLSPATIQELEAAGQEIRSRTEAEVVLVTVSGLNDVPIEDYALALFREWGLGDKEKNNGVLLLVDQERLLRGQTGKVRIEVGYGLEGAIPDGKAGRILDDLVLPPWSSEDFEGGIRAGYWALVAAVAEEYELDLTASEGLSSAADYVVTGSSSGSSLLAIPILALISMAIIISHALRLRYPWLWGKSASNRRPRSPFDDFFGGGSSGGGFSGGGGGGFGGGSSGGGGSTR